jgi:DNA-binding SARP family transcriptional activator
MRHGTLMEPTISHSTRLVEDGRHDSFALAASSFSFRLLGEFELRVDGMLDSRPDMPRLQSLLAYLALHRGVPQARSRIAYALWPDSTDEQAHTNLRNLLFKLRLLLPGVESFLLVERQRLCFQHGAHIRLDVQDFESTLDRAEHARRMQDTPAEQQALEEAVSLYQGDLLPSCYDEWIGVERERLQQIYLRALERLIDLLEWEGCYTEAILVAQHLLRCDLLQEATYRSLMHLHAARGDRGGVWRTYQTCAAVLQRECSVRPGLTTRQTFERLMQADD